MGWLTRERTRRRLIGVGLVLVVLATGGVATTLITALVERGYRQQAEQTMTRTVNDSAVAVKDEVEHYAGAIEDVAAAVGTTTDLTASSFAGITSALSAERLPGASSVSFVVPARDARVAATQEFWRARGAADLSLYRTGTDVEHQFVIFMRTFTKVPATAGRDLSNTPATQDLLAQARRSRSFAVGEAHITVRDRQLPVAEQQITVTMAAPVLDRRGAFRGWVTIGVHGVDFVRTVLSGRTGSAVNVRLVDSDPSVNRTIVTIAGGVPMKEPALNRSRTVDVGQRIWRIDLEPTTGLLGVSDRRLSTFTLLLALLVGVLAGGRNRAMDHAERATAALRRDIERRQAVERELREREMDELRESAFRDHLTGLANRRLFYDRVAHALRTHARGNGTLAVFFVDLDGFKEVNDELGHDAGDEVLRETGARLQDCLRDTDTVSRFGGDEFAIVAERLAGPEDVHITADRMVAALSRPIRIGSRSVTVTASIGVALNRPGDDADTILRAADLAMYEAKTSGKSRHVLSGS